MIVDLGAASEEAGQMKTIDVFVSLFLSVITFTSIKSKIVILLFPSSLAKLSYPFYLLIEHKKHPL